MEKESPPLRVLLTGSVCAAAETLRQVLLRAGCHVETVQDGGPARQGRSGFDLVLVCEEAQAVPRPERLLADGCELLLRRALAIRDGVRKQLTPREVAIVAWLYHQGGQPVTRQDLLQYVWEVAPRLDTRAVDVAIGGLRRKIERDPEHPRIIVTVKGRGYAWGLQDR